MKGLNLPVTKKNGLRVTPADQIDIINGALAGTAFTVTLPAGVLTAVLLVIMAFTSVSMLRKRA